MKQGLGTICVLIAVPAGFFGALDLFSDLWGLFQIKMGWIKPPIEGPGLGIMIGACLLFVAIPLGIFGVFLLKSSPPKERTRSKS